MNRATRIFIASSILFVLVGSGTGCFAIGGSDRTFVHKPTTGQELIDLKSARDTGAISQPEYDRLKDEIVSRPTVGGD